MVNARKYAGKKQLNRSLEIFAKFVNSVGGNLLQVRRESLYNDEPKLFAYSAFYKTKSKKSEIEASGISFKKQRALVRVLGEAVERYCLDNFDERKLLLRKVSDMQRPYLNPTEVISLSKQQLSKKSFQKFIIKCESEFRWIEGSALSSGRKVFVPAQLVFTSYEKLNREPWIRYPISTGAAAGISLENAIYTGVCEIVERDAFMISYLNKLKSPIIDLGSIKDREIDHIIRLYNRYKLELIVFDITTDIKIPSFAAITLDRTGLGPAVSIGLKAGFDIKEVIIGAIEESLMVRAWLRDKFIYNASSYKKSQTIITVEDRAYFWFKPESISHLDFWLKGNNVKKVKLNSTLSDKHNNLNYAVEILKNAGMEVIYVDITQPKMKRYGFMVIKVIIPQLQPLYLDEEYPYFGGRRLYEVPIKLGLHTSPLREDQFNKIPHPFL